MLNVRTINEKNIGEIEIISKEIFTDYYDRKIIIHNIDKQKYLKEINFRPIKGFEYIIDNIILKPLFRLTPILDNKYAVVPIFEKPIEFSLINYKQYGTFRLVSVLSNVCVNSKGIVYDLQLDKFIQPYKTKHKDYFYIKHENNTYKLNRTVAFAWCDNDDYVVNYVVDHLDQDKSNDNSSNLKWLSNRANVSKSHANNNGKVIDERWWVYSSKMNKIFKFTGLKEIDKFFGINYRNIEARVLPFMYKLSNGDILIIEDIQNFQNFNLKKKLHTFGYRYKTKNKNNGVFRYYRILDDVINTFGLIKYKHMKVNNIDSFKSIKSTLVKKHIVLYDISTITIYNQFSDNKYKIELKNLDTKEVLIFDSTFKAGLHFNVGKSLFIFRLNSNIREGVPFEDKDGGMWLVRKSNEEWPIIRYSKKVIKKLSMFEDGKIVKVFDSVREASRLTNFNRKEISSIVKDETDTRFKYV